MAQHSQRKVRRNPIGAFADMQRASERLGKGMHAFEKRQLSGKALLGRAIKSALAKQRVRQLLVLDAKFNIENDAAFNERLFHFLRSPKAKRPFSFAFLDLDYLGKLNKKSYESADRAIALFAKKVSSVAKKHGGFCGRFGGDELKMVVPKGSKVLEAELNRILGEMKTSKLSFSGGIASSSGLKTGSVQETVNALNDVADKAVKASKKAGRARVKIGK